MTRWECVGETAEHVTKYREEWRTVASYVVMKEKTNSTKHTIASYLCSYLDEAMIISHLFFLVGYIKSWWHPHFQWQKHIDPRSKTPGFLAVHMAIHFYVQDRDLNDMMDNWRDDAHFKQFIDSFPQDAEYTADKLVNDFLKQAKLIHTKHFSQWRDKYLHLALGGDAIPAQCISNWLLGKEIPPELPATYYSDTHKTTINTAACYTFLTGDQLPAAYTSKLFFNLHHIAIQESAEGNIIWDENTSENM